MESLLYIQGSEVSPLTPLFLVHAISGLALPYLSLGSLANDNDDGDDDRLVYGISSPIYGNKNYRLPSTLDEVARQYISLIKREVQPEGPYLLGGWSLGGVIALKMAELLEAWGETVLHVVMIDSPNPENYPSFLNRAEHDDIASMTYERVAHGINAPGVTLDDDAGSSSDSQEDEEDDDLALSNLLPRMRRHIHNGLHMICTVRRNYFFPEYCDIPVTLVKCSSLTRPVPSLRAVRKDFLLKTFRDDLMGWQPTRFERFQTVKFKAQHDSAFDKAHVGDLTGILRNVLADIA